ncbi:MAG: hypothetical protein Q8M16_06905 [Pirellulaceae bacterium]|nr:hypothetical protein [Pirellulaceae bacterium]
MTSSLACVVGISINCNEALKFGSPEYFDLMAWPVVIGPSILLSFGSIFLHYVFRHDPTKWIFFLVSLWFQWMLGDFVFHSMDF